jgi:hypothetical protein
MTEHPITPPPELIQRWSEQFEAGRSLYAMFEDIYRAGADAELEACCMEIIDGEGRFYIDETSDRVLLTEDLWTTRRPKPPSLMEQALETLRSMQIDPVILDGINVNKDLMDKYDILRRALESLPF